MRRAATQARYAKAMRLLARDLEVLRVVGRFGQLPTSAIKQLVFHDRDMRVCTRRLESLTRDGSLARIEKRIPGGSQGGSGQYVYQLGAIGWGVIHGGRYRPARAISYHRLAVADVYVSLVVASRDGTLRIHDDKIESEARRDIEGEVFQPDLLLTVDHLERRTRRFIAIEVDMGTQKPNVIRAKLDAYTKAKAKDNGRVFPVYPDVILLTIDNRRKRDLQTIISQHRGDSIFSVYLMDEWPGLLM